MWRPRLARLRVACYRLAFLLALIELVLATSVLNLGRNKRAIGRKQWNMTENYIPSYLMLLSREPPDQPTNTGALGNPADFPAEIKADPNEYARYAFDGNFAGIGVIVRNTTEELYMLANVEAMMRASTKLVNGGKYNSYLRGFDMLKHRPIMNPIATTWHEIEDSMKVRHIFTFGHTSFGLYALKTPEPKPGSRATSNLTGINPTFVQDFSSMESRRFNYDNCWAYSMMHHYYIEKSDEHSGGQYEDIQVKRFWGRWPVKLVKCNKAQVCQFVFDRTNWYKDPEIVSDTNSTDVMPDELTSQGFPCGWQDYGAPIYCVSDKSHIYEEDALREMTLRYLVLKGRRPDPTKRPLKGKFAADCYEQHDWHGNFTAFSVDTALRWTIRHLKQLSETEAQGED